MTGKWEGVWEEILGGNASQLALITDDGAEEKVGMGQLPVAPGLELPDGEAQSGSSAGLRGVSLGAAKQLYPVSPRHDSLPRV